MIRVKIDENPRWYRKHCGNHPSSRGTRRGKFDTRIKRKDTMRLARERSTAATTESTARTCFRIAKDFRRTTTMTTTPVPSRGCVNSSPKDASRRETLITAPSTTCEPMNLEDIPSAISSLELEAGPSLAIAGVPSTTRLWTEAARVSPSATLASRWVRLIRAIYSLRSETCHALPPSSRLWRGLRANLDGNGSPECVLKWRLWDMPSGPPICALRASARPYQTAALLGGRRQW